MNFPQLFTFLAMLIFALCCFSFTHKAAETVELKAALDEERGVHRATKEVLEQAQIEVQDKDAQLKATQSQLLQR